MPPVSPIIVYAWITSSLEGYGLTPESSREDALQRCINTFDAQAEPSTLLQDWPH